MPRIQSTGRKQYWQRTPAPKDFDEHMTWRMRRYLIIAITIAYTLTAIGGLIGFGITRDSRFLLSITPAALIPFMWYLVPMDKRKYDLKLAKINANRELCEAKLRVQMLEAEIARWQGNKSKTPALKP